MKGRALPTLLTLVCFLTLFTTTHAQSPHKIVPQIEEVGTGGKIPDPKEKASLLQRAQKQLELMASEKKVKLPAGSSIWLVLTGYPDGSSQAEPNRRFIRFEIRRLHDGQEQREQVFFSHFFTPQSLQAAIRKGSEATIQALAANQSQVP